MKRELGEELVSRGIKLKQLALLLAVQDTGQMSRAAAILNMTQPAASRMMADLEALLAAGLTQRHPRGITLTPAGERLAERSRHLLRNLDIAGREVRDIDQGRVGTVHLGSVSGPSLDLVLPLVRGLRESEPDLGINITVDSSDRLVAELLSGRLDFYIGRVPENLDPTSFDVIPIGPEPLAMIVREAHALVMTPPESLADCLAYDWVMQPSGGLLRTTIEQYVLARGLSLPPRIIGTSSLMLTLAFVTRSDAIGMMSTAAAAFFAGADGIKAPIRVLAIAPDLAVSPYGIVTLKDRAPTPAAKVILERLALELARPVSVEPRLPNLHLQPAEAHRG